MLCPRGLAHVGVLQVLEENGMEVHTIAGSSMGAYVGALWAKGNIVETARYIPERGILRCELCSHIPKPPQIPKPTSSHNP